MKLLVTGGAGYMGSHIVLQAQAASHACTDVDHLSTGLKQRTSVELAGRGTRD